MMSRPPCRLGNHGEGWERCQYEIDRCCEGVLTPDDQRSSDTVHEPRDILQDVACPMLVHPIAEQVFYIPRAHYIL